MNTKLYSTKEAIEVLKTTRSTFFEHKKNRNVIPKKQGNASFYTPEQIEILQKSLNPLDNWTTSDKQKTESRQTEQTNTSQNTDLINYLKAELEAKNKELKESQKQVQTLSEDVGRWQGRAETFKELSERFETKLLENQQTEKETHQVIDVDVESPPPRTFAEKWRAFWKD